MVLHCSELRTLFLVQIQETQVWVMLKVEKHNCYYNSVKACKLKKKETRGKVKLIIILFKIVWM